MYEKNPLSEISHNDRICSQGEVSWKIFLYLHSLKNQTYNKSKMGFNALYYLL